jgi:EmrB/QacA subfamily drug resistance transporter
VLAVALFMENVDATVIATSLPAIAASIGASPITLKLALTSYYVALAIFIPISGRIADRWGAKRVFRWAIAVFIVGSLGCAFAASLEGFVAARFVQGMGGAMMTPVGRLLLVRAVPKPELVTAMAWFTIPALIGPLIGPPLGGAITTYGDWRWIFLLNLPIGAVGIILATRYLPRIEGSPNIRFDVPGFLLAGSACAGLVFGLSVMSLPALPLTYGMTLAGAGLMAGVGYVAYARRAQAPVLRLSLLGIDTLRAAIFGGTLFRIGAGAVPFLLPLTLQLGFGYSAFESGLVTCTAIGGAILMKFFARHILSRLGFRTTLIAAALLGGGLMAALGLFRPEVPVAAMLALLLIAGFFRSLFFTAVNVLSFAEVPDERAGDATSLLGATQQVAIAVGVALAGGVLELGMLLGGTDTPTIGNFSIAFFAVGAISAAAAMAFIPMAHEAGSAVSGRRLRAE